MTDKIVIDDAAIERALKVWGLRLPQEADVIATAKAALEAALNPPPVPEIPVTVEMQYAGERAEKEYGRRTMWRYYDRFVEIYRAMRALEPKPADPIEEKALRPSSVWTKVEAVRATCCGVYRPGPCGLGDACCMNSGIATADPATPGFLRARPVIDRGQFHHRKGDDLLRFHRRRGDRT